MAKADNLLAVLWLLRSRRRVTAAQIAESLEISVRTAYRYIDALSASGVPVVAESGPDGGYSLPESFRTAPLFFETLELVSLFQASLFAEQAGYPHSAALESALAKVRRNISPDQASDLERHTTGFVVVPSRRGGPVEPWLPELERAVAKEQTLELLYAKPNGEEPEQRVVDPYGLVYRAGLWYVQGFCHIRQALRDFRVDRLCAVRQTGASFRRPADYRPTGEYDDHWIEERLQQGELTLVRLTGDPPAITALCEHWYLSRCLVERRGKMAVFRIDPTGLQHTAAQLASLGAAVTIVEPISLRRAVAEILNRWLAHHQQDP